MGRLCYRGCRGDRARAVTLPRCPAAGLSTEKAVAFTRRLRAEPQFLLAQNVATCNDPLEVCLQRQVVQDTVQVFQHAVPAEGKPVTNQKNSGKGGRGRGRCLGVVVTLIVLLGAAAAPEPFVRASEQSRIPATSS